MKPLVVLMVIAALAQGYIIIDGEWYYEDDDLAFRPCGHFDTGYNYRCRKEDTSAKVDISHIKDGYIEVNEGGYFKDPIQSINAVFYPCGKRVDGIYDSRCRWGDKEATNYKADDAKKTDTVKPNNLDTVKQNKSNTVEVKKPDGKEKLYNADVEVKQNRSSPIDKYNSQSAPPVFPSVFPSQSRCPPVDLHLTIDLADPSASTISSPGNMIQWHHGHNYHSPDVRPWLGGRPPEGWLPQHGYDGYNVNYLPAKKGLMKGGPSLANPYGQGRDNEDRQQRGNYLYANVYSARNPESSEEPSSGGAAPSNPSGNGRVNSDLQYQGNYPNGNDPDGNVPYGPYTRPNEEQRYGNGRVNNDWQYQGNYPYGGVPYGPYIRPSEEQRYWNGRVNNDWQYQGNYYYGEDYSYDNGPYGPGPGPPPGNPSWNGRVNNDWQYEGNGPYGGYGSYYENGPFEAYIARREQKSNGVPPKNPSGNSRATEEYLDNADGGESDDKPFVRAREDPRSGNGRVIGDANGSYRPIIAAREESCRG